MRAGTVTGSSAGAGGRGGSITAPPDNLAAIMRDATIIVDAGVRPAVTLHMTEAPRLVEQETLVDPKNEKRREPDEPSEGSS